MKQLLLVLCIACALVRVQAQQLNLLFLGDFMQHGPQIEAAKDSTGAYNYDHYFDYINPLIHTADLTIANLEVTLAGAPFSGYPQFSAPDEYAYAIQNAGIDILTTANNHSNDRGAKGLLRTLDVLDTLQMPHLGTYRDTAERAATYPMIIDRNGLRIALLTYTYGTNGIKTVAPQVVNMIEEGAMLADLEEVKTLNVDFTVVIMHWGTEYLSHPDKYQRTWGEWLLSQGVDAVIGGHPHWVQPMELRTDSATAQQQLITWSLGNIVSNQRREHTDGGAAVQFTVVKDADGTVRIKDAGYHLHWVWVDERVAQKRYRILPSHCVDTLAGVIPPAELEKFQLFLRNERTLLDTHNVAIPEVVWDPLKQR